MPAVRLHSVLVVAAAAVMVVVVGFTAPAAAQGEYDSCYTLGGTGAMTLSWTINGGNIDVELKGMVTGGYISVGLYPADAIQRPTFHTQGGDPLIDMWVASAGTVFDGTMTGQNVQTDAQNDLQNGVATEVDGVLTATFSRALATGDADDLDIPLGPLTVGFACSQNQPAAPNQALPQHDGTIDCGGVATVDFAQTYTCDLAAGTFTSPNGEIQVDWMAVGDAMEFTMIGQTAGWVSFGIGDGAHLNADMFVGWVDGGGAPTLLDTFSNARTDPIVDVVQDLTLISADETNGVTTIVFSRPLLAVDPLEDRTIIDDDVSLNWAVCPDDGVGLTFPKHNLAGTATVNFLAVDGEVRVGGDNYSAGFGVLMVSAAVFTLYVLIRWTKKSIKFCCKKKRDYDYDAPMRAVRKEERMRQQQQAAAAGARVASFADFAPPPPGGGGPGGYGDFANPGAYVPPTLEMGPMGGGGDVAVPWGAVEPEQDYYAPAPVAEASPAKGKKKMRFGRKKDKAPRESVGGGGGRTSVQRRPPARPETIAPRSNEPSGGGGGGFTMAQGGGGGGGGAKKKKKPQRKPPPRPTTMAPVHGPDGVAGPLGGDYIPPEERARLAAGPVGGGTRPPSQFFRGSMMVDDSAAMPNNFGMELGGGGGGYDPAFEPTYDPALADRYGNGQYDNDDGADRRRTLTPAKQVQTQEQSNAVAKACMQRVPRSRATVFDVCLAFVWVVLNLGFVFVFPFPNGPLVRDQFAYLTAANGVLSVMPATRNSLISWLLGLPFDHTVMYHRWIGRWTVLCAVAHHALSLYDVGFTAQIDGGLAGGSKYFMGFVSAVAVYVVFLTSIETLRRKKFQLFYFLHFIFIVFFVFGALHSADMVPYVLVAGGFYALDRIVRLFWGLFPRSTTRLAVKNGDIVQIRFARNRFATYRPGNYVFINIPRVSMLEWHPFTLSSSPLEPECEVHIKALGDHTRAILDKAQASDSLKIRVDGPYGRFSLNHRRYETLLLYCGGVGVTPMISLLKTVFQYNAARVPETRGQTKNVIFVWTCKTEEDYAIFDEDIRGCMGQSLEPGMPAIQAFIHVTQAQFTNNPNLLPGRPAVDFIYNTVEQTTLGGRVAVYTCGPAAMVKEVWDAAKARSSTKIGYDVHHEVFDW